MSRRIALLTLLTTIFLSNTPAQAQNAPLRWQWHEGDQTRYKLTERMHQTISGSSPTELLWIRESGFEDHVRSQGPDGATIERHFRWVSVSVSRDAGDPVRYDTRDAQANPADADLLLIRPFIALAGKSIVFTVDDEGNVTDLNGSSETLDAMLGPLAVGKLARAVGDFSNQPSREKRLARQLEQALRLIPGRPVRRGEHWPVQIDHATPLAGPLTTDLTATLDHWNRRRHTAEITLAGTLRRREDEEKDGFAALLPIHLDSGEITGIVRFDTRQGRVSRSEIKIETTWSIDAGLTPNDEPMHQTLMQQATLQQVENKE